LKNSSGTLERREDLPLPIPKKTKRRKRRKRRKRKKLKKRKSLMTIKISLRPNLLRLPMIGNGI